MNLALSDEQVFLREAARGALSRFKTLEAAREALDGNDSALPDLWPTAKEAGWPGLLIDEAHGGAGLDAFDAMLVLGSTAPVHGNRSQERLGQREPDENRGLGGVLDVAVGAFSGTCPESRGRRKMTDPANAARRDGGKPEGKPQGGTEGGREKAARPDRGSALSSVGSSRPERVEVFGNRRTVYGKVTSLEPPD